ncbi:MAG: prolipoprotein diacylglyceryl transferase [Candidatus Coatesbacteria bacterium]|nr:MAG: prolipoprotein diacylglyceryl transferase [Candidatus Coatesbacteria bacterium]
MSYPKGVVPTFENVHPTPIYSALLFFGLFLLLWFLRKKEGPAVGWLFLVYVIGTAVIRFFLEYVRTTPEVFLGFTLTQLISIGMILTGVIWLAKMFWAKRRAA